MTEEKVKSVLAAVKLSVEAVIQAEWVLSHRSSSTLLKEGAALEWPVQVTVSWSVLLPLALNTLNSEMGMEFVWKAVAVSYTWSAAAIASGSCTADDGASVNPITTTANSVPFGTVNPNVFTIGCQDLAVSTNAGSGYSLAVQEQTLMQTAGVGFTVPDTTCDAGTCTEAVAGTWTSATNNGLGHTCANQSSHDCNSAYSSGTNFRQFANIAGGETAQAVMSSSTPATATGRVKYRLAVSSGQAAGTYTNLIVYTITATY